MIVTGLKEIWAHKFRSILTMFGIILGVSSLVAMSAVVKGMENGLKEALSASGGLEKIRIEAEDDLPDYQKHLQDQAKGLTMHDVYALQNSSTIAHTVTPNLDRHRWRGGIQMEYKGKYTYPYIFSGTWPSAAEINDHVIEHGRMFTHLDNELNNSVCVIGTGIRDELFGSPTETGEPIVPIGEVINIENTPFTVIGMFQHYESEKARRERELAAQNAPGSDSGPARNKGRGGSDHWAFRVKNNTVYVPLNTMLLKLSSGDEATPSTDPRLSEIHMKIDSFDQLEHALQQVRNILMVAHNGIEDFAFTTQEDWAEQITVQIKNARNSGMIIASICLIVGGIGIMNIMLASISERVREIGIRKAVGARTEDVFAQIIIESVVVAMLGALAGLVVSNMLVRGIEMITPSDNAPVVTLGSMIVAFCCSTLIGILAGLYPAIKASRMHPIQALRYD